MSATTIRLCEIVRLRGGTTSIVEGMTILDKPEILYLDAFPIYREAHRPFLIAAILDTFWNREIAYETDDMFLQQMRVKLQTYMPMMNELYKTLDQNYDMLTTMDMTTTGTGVTENTSERDTTATSNAASESRSGSLSSTHPQQSLDPGNLRYSDSGATGFSDSTSDNDANEKATGTDLSENESTSRTVGYAGSPAALIQAYRDTVISVDRMILDELESCFMQTWGSPHSFTSNRWS